MVCPVWFTVNITSWTCQRVALNIKFWKTWCRLTRNFSTLPYAYKINSQWKYLPLFHMDVFVHIISWKSWYQQKSRIQTSSFAVISAALHYLTFCRWRKQVHENGRKSNCEISEKLLNRYFRSPFWLLEPVLWGHWSHNKKSLTRIDVRRKIAQEGLIAVV